MYDNGMDGQMNLFEFTKPRKTPILCKENEGSIVEFISASTGLKFVYDDSMKKFRSDVKNVIYTIEISRFSVEPFTKFISCGWDDKKRGEGSPCKTVEEAVNFFKKAIKKQNNG